MIYIACICMCIYMCLCVCIYIVHAMYEVIIISGGFFNREK